MRSWAKLSVRVVSQILQSSGASNSGRCYSLRVLPHTYTNHGCGRLRVLRDFLDVTSWTKIVFVEKESTVVGMPRNSRTTLEPYATAKASILHIHSVRSSTLSYTTSSAIPIDLLFLMLRVLVV